MSAATSKPPAIRADASSNMLSIIAQAAADPRVDVIKMTALLDLQEKLLNREAQREFNQALARMNIEDLRVLKNGIVHVPGKVSYKFAKWEDMDRVIRPLMQREGFTLSFDTTTTATGGLVVIGELLHEGGHSRTARIPLALDTGPGRNALQAMGSTVSYGKRYVTEMLLNIVREDEDDDGVSGAPPPPPAPPPRYTAPARPEPAAAPAAAATTKRGRTAREWLDNLALNLSAAQTQADVDAIATSEDVVKVAALWAPENNNGDAEKNRRNAANLDDLNALMAEALARVKEAPHDPETGEADDNPPWRYRP
jgi:hypothetical protein